MARIEKTVPSKASCLAVIALLILAPPSIWGERDDAAHPRHRLACLNDLGPASTGVIHYRALRFIDDPGTGRYWVMLQQLDRTKIPPLLVQIPRGHPCVSPDVEVSVEASSPAVQNLSRAVIHLGDRILLSQSTPTIHAQLDAVALHAAAVGETFSVRLNVSGHLVQVVATAPGRASLLVDETRGWR
jgi:hypothetical protein